MNDNLTGGIRRIDDLGRITIPRELRRKLKVRDGDAFEIGTVTLENGKEVICLTPYNPIEAGTQRQLEAALAALAMQLPEGYEVGLLGESGPIASTKTGRKVTISFNWNAVPEDDAHWAFVQIRDHGHHGYRKISEKDMLYYPVKSDYEVILVLGILGYDVSDGDALMVRATADVLSAMLS